jgi:hypothetical protein
MGRGSGLRLAAVVVAAIALAWTAQTAWMSRST